MAVKIGSARIDERGKITGGAAGDQTKNEVGTQNWYKHSKGWRTFRCNDAEKAQKIAKCMQMACDNNNIGYDQNSRNSLYTKAKPYNFDVSKVSAKTETDCSALVRVCCAYAGITVKDFNTAGEASALLATGAFTELKDSKYNTSSDYLRAGDIQVTKTKGHTIVVLSNGSKAETSINNKPTEYKLGDRILHNGMEGSDVKELQEYLIELDYSLGKWGADGDFGDATEIAVRSFQKTAKLSVDGEVGPKTITALESALDDIVVKDAKQIKIIGGNCYVRQQPSTSSKAIGTAKKGEFYDYLNEKSETGWHKINFKNEDGWVSGKYSELV